MTAFTHAAVALAVGTAIVPHREARLQLLLGACFAVMPDIDLLAPYLGGERDFHRRFTHSILFALIGGIFGATSYRLTRHRAIESIRFGCLAALAILSHPISDMMTTYPLGVALASPFSQVRYHLPWQPVTSVTIEFEFVLLPVLVIALTMLPLRRIWVRTTKASSTVTLQLR